MCGERSHTQYARLIYSKMTPIVVVESRCRSHTSVFTDQVGGSKVTADCTGVGHRLHTWRSEFTSPTETGLKYNRRIGGVERTIQSEGTL